MNLIEVYWNEYKSKREDVTQAPNITVFKRSLLDAKIPDVNRLFVAAFPDSALKNSHRRYFLPLMNIKSYNVLIDGRNFYDQNIFNDFKNIKIKESNDRKRRRLQYRIIVRL